MIEDLLANKEVMRALLNLGAGTGVASLAIFLAFRSIERIVMSSRYQREQFDRREETKQQIADLTKKIEDNHAQLRWILEDKTDKKGM